MRLASCLFAFQASSFLYPSAVRSVRAFATTASTSTSTSSSSSSSTSSSAMASTTKNLVVDPFCYRQFQQYEQSKTYGGTVFSLSIEEFEKIVNERYESENLKDGYAPFCKHIFLINDFTGDDGKANVLPVKGNEHLIRSEYAARNEKEVPVLQRFIPLDDIVGGIDHLPVAKYLDLILYSREQIQKENASMNKGKTEVEENETAPWGIVSIKAQDENFELPMNPYVSIYLSIYLFVHDLILLDLCFG
ncbi:MAG: hypothetical protein ACI90V_014066 [Bacillariaceae sp.]|jgi:hypothetical protein